jgi:predicted ester cyclase
MGIPPTGKPIEVSSIIVSRFDNGKWAEDWVLIDMLGMLQQLGVIPTPGQSA